MADKDQPGKSTKMVWLICLDYTTRLSVLCYIYITLYARYLAVRYVIFNLLRKWTQNFSPRLVGLTADHDASRGGRFQGSLEAHVPPP